MSRALIATGLLCALLSGCAHTRPQQQVCTSSSLPVSEAPKFSLTLSSEPTISTVSSQVEPDFRFRDERPVHQKNYYPGETDPHHWRDAVTVMPMESFEPDLRQLLRKRVFKALANPSAYDAVTLTVNSFYVALDERGRARSELASDFGKWESEQERRQEEKELRRRQESEDDDAGDRVMKGLILATIVNPAQSRRHRTERAEQLLEYPQSIPRSLTEKTESGWNCNIEATLALHIDGKPDQVVTLASRSHASKDDAKTVEANILGVVNSAVTDLQSQITSAAFNGIELQ